MNYYMQLNGMYVTELEFSYKEIILKNALHKATKSDSVRIKSIEIKSGKVDAIKFVSNGTVDFHIIEELESLGFEKEKVEDLKREEYGGLLVKKV